MKKTKKVITQARKHTWNILHCSSKDETPSSQVLAKWTMAFFLIGGFLLLLGVFMIRKGSIKVTDNSKLLVVGPVILILSGTSFAVSLILCLGISSYSFYKRRKRENDPLSQLFMEGGYPQVVEILDWGTITPTRTESDIDENDNRSILDLPNIIEVSESVENNNNYIGEIHEQQLNTLDRKKMKQQKRKEEIQENKELKQHHKNIQDKYRLCTETEV